MVRKSTLALLAGGAHAVGAALQIVPGATWTADDGRHVQAHGAGVVEEDGTYYLIGEDKTGGSAFQNVNCYSSTDLVQWHYVGALLSRTASGDLGPNRVVERPKVIKNDRTGKYILWMHIDSSNYGEAKVGVAVGDSVCGKYQYQRSFRPLGFQSRDQGLFKDDDGTAYLLTEDRENGLRINKLTADYLDVAGSTYLWRDSIEAPALLKRDGRYYMFGSKLTGWDPNDNVYSVSASLAGGWSAWRTFADAGSNTYASQTTYVLPLNNGSGTAVYLGDRWVSSNLQASTYVWLPLAFDGAAAVSMKNQAAWAPNLGSGGTWSAGGAEVAYEGEAAAYGGGARDVACAGCSGGRAAGYIGGGEGEGGTLTFGGVRGGAEADALTTVRVRYGNGDTGPRYAAVRVNGGDAQRVAFENSRGGVGSSSFAVPLRRGADNTLVFQGIDGGWGPDFDQLLVPAS